jgi:hypothetical protein
MTCDLRDWFVIVCLTMLVFAATVYLFLHPSDVNFGTWGAILGTGLGGYHWLVLWDSKRPDAT